MMQAMIKAGFVGVDTGPSGEIFARAHPAQPEFCAVPLADGVWRFSIVWPLRASDAQRDDWLKQHPDAPLDVDLGETRMQFYAGPEGLGRWSVLLTQMIATCTLWRRAARQQDEGM